LTTVELATRAGGRHPKGWEGKQEHPEPERYARLPLNRRDAATALPLATRRRSPPLNITIEIVWTCEVCTSPLIDGTAHDCGVAEATT
jgi:hypothetical protein